MTDTLENAPVMLQPGQAASLPNLMGDQSTAIFDQMVKSAFMGRVQLCGGSSALAIEGKIAIGKFAFVRRKDDFIDFGDTFNCVPLSWRFAALRFGAETTEAYYDPNSDEFKQIQIDSEESDSKCAYGPQFLIWVPQIKEFATYLFGSKSARPEARKLNPMLNKGATFRGKLVASGGNKWHVPIVLPCSTPLELPLEAIAISTAEKFNKPPKAEFAESESQASTPPGGEGARAR